MGYLNKEQFICLDCETTGLDIEKDRVIEFAAILFTFDEKIKEYETLIDPDCVISQKSIEIHNIDQTMVQGKPRIKEVLPFIEEMTANYTIVGHGVDFDIQMLCNSAKREGIPFTLHQNKVIDTLRLARHYGQAPVNSLQGLRIHFDIDQEIAHRAMGDVIINIEVFKRLVHGFKTTNEVFSVLSKPILLRYMPLGKYKGREFSELPTKYLGWASHQDFDQDLLHSIRYELKKRRKGDSFSQATNPFKQILDF